MVSSRAVTTAFRTITSSPARSSSSRRTCSLHVPRLCMLAASRSSGFRFFSRTCETAGAAASSRHVSGSVNSFATAPRTGAMSRTSATTPTSATTWTPRRGTTGEAVLAERYRIRASRASTASSGIAGWTASSLAESQRTTLRSRAEPATPRSPGITRRNFRRQAVSARTSTSPPTPRCCSERRSIRSSSSRRSAPTSATARRLGPSPWIWADTAISTPAAPRFRRTIQR